jgi:hypothetical protein
MGVNKNISIFLLFDCVQVNTGLGFHWICYRKKEKKGGGGICELMMISILNHFSLFRLLVVFDWWKYINMEFILPFWVIMRSGRRNVMNHIATKRTIFGRRGCGEFFLPWVILGRERHHDHIWISKFLWRQFGGRVMPLYGIWAGWTLIWVPPPLHGFLGRIKCVSPYYSWMLFCCKIQKVQQKSCINTVNMQVFVHWEIPTE